MPFEKMNNQELQDYGDSLQGGDISNEVTFGETALRGGIDVLTSGPTAAVVDLVKEGFSALSQTEPDNMISGDEANKLYDLTGEDAFEVGERISGEDATARNHIAYKKRMDVALDEMGTAQGTSMGMAQFLGGLGLGMLDPVSLVGGAVVGAGMRGVAAGVAAKQAATSAPYSMIYKTAQALSKSNGTIANTLEAMSGAAVLDAPASAYFADKYKQDFRTKEFLMQVAGAGVFGATLPKVVDKIKYVASQQAFVSTMMKKFGSKSTHILGEILHHTELATQLDAYPDSTVVPKIHAIQEWKPREGQTAHTHTEIGTGSQLEGVDFHVGRKTGSKEFNEISNHGTGTVTLLENDIPVKNGLQDIDGKSDGEVKTIRVQDGSSVLTPENFGTAKTAILKEFQQTALAALKNNKSGGDLKDSLVHLKEVMELAGSMDNITDLHEVISLSAVSRNPEMYLNSAIKKSGFDGYHAKVSDPINDQVSNALVLIDAVNTTELQKTGGSYDMLDGMVDDNDLIAGDGIVSFFDETKVDVIDRQLVAKADVTSKGIKSIRQETAEILKSELARMLSPEGKKAYVKPSKTDEEVAKVLASDTTEDVMLAAEDSVAAIAEREDIPIELISKEDQEFIAKADERLKSTDTLIEDLTGCILKG